ncbi:MAG: ribonucleoside triphosphate reductase [Candidatus Colwellbacteria bacterium]|nr:ribonucleoside triphosphate reductase [Candidatus Colwellbacteria bacterium]
MTVIKRDGTKAEFNKDHIYAAIMKAAEATGEFGSSEARKITEIVAHYIGKTEKLKSEISVEEIQDIVEFSLMSSGYFKTARAYIVYREKRSQARAIKGAVIEVEGAINEYVDQADWRVHENANLGYSLGGMIIRIAGKVVANYWLHNVYSEEIRDAHRSGDFHIHDLDFFAGYCAGWSLRQLLEEGLNGVPGKIESKPPKHLGTAVNQMVNFLGTLQNEWAGAQAFSSFDTYLAPFVKRDNLSYGEVKQCVQSFVFGLNTPSRWGTQTPFTNITLDWVVPDDMKERHPVIGGEASSFTYGECQKEMDMLNKAYIEVMTEGDMNGRAFSFPIPTYNITKDFKWDTENAQLLFEMAAKFGIPYFQNFINSSLNPSDVRSMCCRLQLDLKELRARGGGLFGSAELTGSLGVVTLNLARIGYLSKSRKEFFDRVGRLMDIAKQSLEIKRKVVSENMERGLLPFTKRYLGTLNNHFSTIGINGMNEACLNFMGRDIADSEAKKFTLEILDFMRGKLSEYQQETGNLYNLEATPAEGATYRFAREDAAQFPGIIQAGEKDAPYYTNSTHLPVSYTDDPLMALDHQDELQAKYTGGTVLHMFLGERIKDWKTCRNFVKKVAENYKLPYITITPTFSICREHGYLFGEIPKCPECGKDCEIWSRVVGYYRPVSQWNKGKQTEFADRKEYMVPKGKQ